MTTRWILGGLILILLSLLLVGCDEDPVEVVAPGTNKATCEGCHTSEAMLRATVLPDPEPPEDEGEG